MSSGDAHGWNIDIVARIEPGIPVLLEVIYLMEGMEEMPAESLVFCTLLGPEGPDLPMRFSKCSVERKLRAIGLRWRLTVFGLRCDRNSFLAQGVPPVF